MACFVRVCAALAATLLVLSAVEIETVQSAALDMNDLLKSVLRESSSQAQLRHSNLVHASQQHRQRGRAQDRYPYAIPMPAPAPTKSSAERRRQSLSKELEAMVKALLQDRENDTGRYNTTGNEDGKDFTPKEDSKEKTGGNPNWGEKTKGPCNHDHSTTEDASITTTSEPTDAMTTTTTQATPPLLQYRRKMSYFQQEQEKEDKWVDIETPDKQTATFGRFLGEVCIFLTGATYNKTFTDCNEPDVVDYIKACTQVEDLPALICDTTDPDLVCYWYAGTNICAGW